VTFGKKEQTSERTSKQKRANFNRLPHVCRLPGNNPDGTATRGRDCEMHHPRAIAPPTLRAHTPDNFKLAQPRMKKNPNKALHRTAHKAPPVSADVGHQR